MKKLIGILLLFLTLTTSTGFANGTDYFNLNRYEHTIRHEDVKLIQSALKLGGYYKEKEFTNKFDEKTKEAVIAFQNDNVLEANGVVDADTFDKLEEKRFLPIVENKEYKYGAKEHSVKHIQLALVSEKCLYLYGNPVENYGYRTKGGIKKFQEKYELEVTGICDETTLLKMAELNLIIIRDENTELRVIGNLTKDIYENGDNNSEVMIIQKALGKFGFLKLKGNEYTTYYGRKTQSAVKEFQKENSLEVTGKITKPEIDKLVQLRVITNKKIFSRGGKRNYGQFVKWEEIKPIFTKGETILTVEDFETGRTFNVMVLYGTAHYDVEPLTLNDTKTIKELWGGSYNWSERAALVHYDGAIYSAGISGMPHGGVESEPFGKQVENRSGGYGSGINFDTIKGNEFSGHLCVYFRDSKDHGSSEINEKFQDVIKKASGL